MLRASLLLAGLLVAGCTPSPQTTDSAMPRTVISTDQAPGALGPYSQAIQVGPHLYCAGQIGIDPATGQLVEGGVQAETQQALANLQAVVEAAGFTMGDAVQVQVFLADLTDFDAMNGVYATFFPDSPPARAAFEVARLPRDARVEIMLKAIKGE
ncbi:MAG: Rid family detoxifying hydrolase [Bacteroidota bacterium]